MKISDKTKYKLMNVASCNIFEDTGWLIEEPDGKPSLIRAVYEKKQLDTSYTNRGIYRFADWLPVNHFLQGSSAPVTYKSKGLGKLLGLNNLYITFNGYYPEIAKRIRFCRNPA